MLDEVNQSVRHRPCHMGCHGFRKHIQISQNGHFYYFTSIQLNCELYNAKPFSTLPRGLVIGD